jgi:hypothetical protein
MTMPSHSPWDPAPQVPPPAGYGAPPGPNPRDQLVPFGVASLIMSGVLAMMVAYRALAALLAAALDEAQRALLPGNVPAQVQAIANTITKMLRRITNLELLTLSPAALCTMALFVVAVGLMMKKRWALTGAGLWSLVAFLSAGLIMVLQVLLVVPELNRVEKAIAKFVAAAPSTTHVTAPTMVRLVLPAVVLGIFAVVALAGWLYLRERVPDE